jgi:hypothetical protein
MNFYPGKLKFNSLISYWEMDETSVRQLNSLYVLHPFDTVVSSSWKHFVSREHVEELFIVNNLALHLHEDWCTPSKFTSERCHEISMWLDDHREGDFCPSHIILDDPQSGGSLENNIHEVLGFSKPLLINPDVGIDSETYQTMLDIVKGWAYDYKTRKFMRKKMKTYNDLGGVGI